MKIFCKIFGHKWVYYKLYATNQKLRYCKRCNILQYREWHIRRNMMTWHTAIEYTDAGARKFVEGYGEV